MSNGIENLIQPGRLFLEKNLEADKMSHLLQGILF